MCSEKTQSTEIWANVSTRVIYFCYNWGKPKKEVKSNSLHILFCISFLVKKKSYSLNWWQVIRSVKEVPLMSKRLLNFVTAGSRPQQSMGRWDRVKVLNKGFITVNNVNIEKHQQKWTQRQHNLWVRVVDVGASRRQAEAAEACHQTSTWTGAGRECAHPGSLPYKVHLETEVEGGATTIIG